VINMSGSQLLSRQSRIWLFLIAPLLLVVLFVYAIPLVGVASWSVTRPEPGLDNFREVATNAQIHGIFLRTAVLCVLASVIATAFAFLLSVAMVFGSRLLREVVEFAVLVPFWISVLIRAFGWIVLLRNNGIVNNALIDLGVTTEPIALVRNNLGVLVGMVHFLIPFAVFPIASNIRQIDTQLIVAARGLGAGRFLTFRSVLLPLALPGVVGGFLMVLVFSLGFFVTPSILGGGRVVMAAEYVFLQISQTSQWGLGSAIAVVLFAVVAMLLGLLKLLTRAEEAKMA